MKGESQMRKKQRQFRIDPDLLERFDRINEKLSINGSEVIRRLIREYVEQKEKELGRVAEGEGANQTKRNKGE